MMMRRTASSTRVITLPTAYKLWMIIGLAWGLAGWAANAAGTDWPQYRADATRSGYVNAQLPDGLSLRWSYQPRQQPEPAWLGPDTRMPFDQACQPVIAGGMLYFGSSADGKVYALAAATGAGRWTFFTGAPVRFAPALWQGRVFVASDDGYLYCLAGQTGELLWRKRGGPADDQLLGNGRMISRWPARGGPVIRDGIVYFAAGIWPSERVYLYALDAASGKVLWCNDNSGTLVMDQPHPTARARSGIAPQGYLVATASQLLVPNGRGIPAAFSRDKGKLQYFFLQMYGKVGGADIVAAADHFFNGGRMFDVLTGKSRGLTPAPGLITAAPDRVVFATSGKLTVSRWVEEEVVDAKGAREKIRQLSPMPPQSKPSSQNKLLAGSNSASREVSSIILIGDSAVLGSTGRVSVRQTTSSDNQDVDRWSVEVKGNVRGLAFAEGRLYASTDQGLIYCFGAKEDRPPMTRQPAPAAAPYGDNTLYAAAAEEIVRRTGVTAGYAVDLGCGDGALAYELARRTNLQIYAVDADPERVRQARERLDDAGLYGTRVTVHLGDPARSQYSNAFADLVISGRSVAGAPEDVPAQEMARLQRPWGGVGCTGKPGVMSVNVRGALAGAGVWTHQYCDPANTATSSDTLIRAPLGMLWFRDYAGLEMASRHGRPPAPLFSNGRFFVMGENALYAMDAYNGRHLWSFDLPGILTSYDQDHLMGTAVTGSCFCLEGDSIYVRTRDRCLRLATATGKQLAEYKLSGGTAGKDNVWGFIAVEGGTLFGSTALRDHVVSWSFKPSAMGDQLSESTSFFAIDVATGKPRWTYQARHSIRHNAIAIGAGRVYLIDRPLAQSDLFSANPRLGAKGAKSRKATPKIAQLTGELIALDAATGNVLWRSADNIYGTMLALSVEHDILLMCYQRNRSFRLPSELGGCMAALRASNGKRLWDIEAEYAARPMLNGRTIYAQPGAWDLLTGEQKDFELIRSHGCGIVAGSQKLLTFRSATLGFRDLTQADSQTENYGGIRPGCWINAIPAGGLVLQPDATEKCTCGYLNKSFIALQPMGP